jgi:uncharacterized protein with PIN domain
MAKKPPRPRTEARVAERARDKTAQAAQKLWFLEAGGTPERPIEVTTAAVIEARATSARCPLCFGELRVADHEATTVAPGSNAKPLRVVTLRCFRCGGVQRSYFHIGTALPS